jgi:hypothetical protein
VAKEEPEEPPLGLVSPTFRKLANQFFEHSLREYEPTTWRMHKIYLRSFKEYRLLASSQTSSPKVLKRAVVPPSSRQAANGPVVLFTIKMKYL